MQTSWQDSGVIPPFLQIAATGDFNADGTRDILWRASNNGDTAIATYTGGQFTAPRFGTTSR
jgi:hypothetical protein